MSDGTHESPIKTPQQLIAAVVLAFIVPIVVIVLLVSSVNSSSKTGAGSNAQSPEAVAERLRPVARVEVKAAGSAAARGGEVVYKAQCAACHEAGVAGAPKFGDAGAWGGRIKAGYEALLASALKGKGAMAAQAGGEFSDAEIGNAVVYMANAGGAKFAEPKAAAGAAAPAADAGKKLYEATCAACHSSGAAGAPKVGDKAAWAARAKDGMNHMLEVAIKGKGGMPPKGGSSASDDELKAAIQYMLDNSK